MSKKNNDNDVMILQLKKEIELKKKTLRSSEKFSPKTNCSLSLQDKRYNLNVIDKETLIFLLGTLLSLQNNFNSVYPGDKFEFCGYDIGFWIDDIKSKYNNLNRNLELQRLQALESRLHNLLSIDKKVELEITELRNEIMTDGK